jgi:hypothetical protein
MKLTNSEEKTLAIGAVLVLGYLLFVRGAAASAGQAIGSSVVGAGTGTVIGIGEGLGIPQTDQTQCQKDIAAGDMWNASFSCPAGTFLKNVF